MIPLQKGIEGLIFDCDGTLADTMPWHYRAWQEVLAQAGGHFPSALFYQLGGKPTTEIAAILNERFGYGLEPTEAAAAKEERFLAYLPQVRPIGPVVETARFYQGRLPMAIGSGNLRWLIDRTLEVIGMADFFEVIVTSEDVARGKPAPDTFLEAAARLGVEPARCQVFEDGDLGLEAAQRAAMAATDIRPWLGADPAAPALEETL